MGKFNDVPCSKCGRLFARGTLATEFDGYGRTKIAPRGRWYSESDVRVVRFPVERKVCVDCGGEKIEPTYRVSVHKQAKDAWSQIGPDSPLFALRGKR